MICVHLGERAVEFTVSTDSHLHGNAGEDNSIWKRATLSSFSPLSAGEFSRTNPSLVDVYHSHTICELTKDKFCVVPPKQEAPIRVAKIWVSFDPLIPCTKVVA